MGKKYIIEIPEDKIADFVGSTHFLMPYMMAGHIGHHDTGLPIEPYTEPDLEQVRKEAYGEGFRDGQYAERNGLTVSYAQEQEEIKVGDEVVSEDDIKAVVIDMDDYLLHVLDENGLIQGWPREDVVKTDRHFPDIATVLKKMKEVQK